MWQWFGDLYCDGPVRWDRRVAFEKRIENVLNEELRGRIKINFSESCVYLEIFKLSRSSYVVLQMKPRYLSSLGNCCGTSTSKTKRDRASAPCDGSGNSGVIIL